MSYLSQADLGGRAETAVVVREAEEERFHGVWEERVLALTLAMGATGLWNIDMSRAARETLPDYRQLSYYRIWFKALKRLVAERGLLDRPIPVPSPALRARDVAAALRRGSPTQRASSTPARFKVGDWVRTRSELPAHHTRLPGYARGRRGIIERVHGVHVFSDTHAQGRGESPQWLYSVSFEASALWGPALADPAGEVTLDAFEAYLTLD